MYNVRRNVLKRLYVYDLKHAYKYALIIIYNVQLNVPQCPL